jgi:hypothetical protein
VSQKIDYLGYEITRDGIQPQPNKEEAILKLSPLAKYKWGEEQQKSVGRNQAESESRDST